MWRFLMNIYNGGMLGCFCTPLQVNAEKKDLKGKETLKIKFRIHMQPGSTGVAALVFAWLHLF
jgi:hypothetical protein